MSCAPGIIFTRRSKKNPYADRGLVEFARLSAELEAKRRKLLVQLGNQLSFVRFAVGSDQDKWIPIIICPTLAPDEIRTLRRTATNLISEDRSAWIDGETAQEATIVSGVAKRHDLTKGSASAQNHPHATDAAPADSSPWKFAHMIATAEKFLWMAAFGLSIVADIFRNALGVKAQPVTPLKRRPDSSKEEIVNKHSRSASSTMASPVRAPSLPALHTPASRRASQNIKTKGPQHPLHVRAPNAHIRWKDVGCSTAPSTPTNSRQPKKAFLATVSLPKTCTLEEQGDATQLHSTRSLPRTTHLQESDVQRSSKFRVEKVERKERAERLGQALTGAGVVVGLGGLVMGYLPAIASIVCWWYLIPTLRKAVGDKPKVIKSQHHHGTS